MHTSHLHSRRSEASSIDRFEEVLRRHIAENVTLQRNFECLTPWAAFSVDLVAVTPTQRIAFRCDGWNSRDLDRGEIIDSLILGHQCAETIYTFSQDRIGFALYDLIYIVSLYDPEIFTERGRKVLFSQASQTLQKHVPDGYGGYISGYRCDDQEPDEEQIFLRVTRNSTRMPPGRRAFWQVIYNRSREDTQLSLEGFIDKQLNGWKSPDFQDS